MAQVNPYYALPKPESIKHALLDAHVPPQVYRPDHVGELLTMKIDPDFFP